MWYFSNHPKRWLFIPKKNLRLATPPCLCWDILLLLLSSSNVNQASLTSPDIFLRNKITYPSPVLGGLGLVGHGAFCSFFGLRRCFLCVEGWREEQKLEVTQTKSRIFWTLWRRKNLTLKPFRKNMAEFMLHSTLKRCKKLPRPDSEFTAEITTGNLVPRVEGGASPRVSGLPPLRLGATSPPPPDDLRLEQPGFHQPLRRSLSMQRETPAKNPAQKNRTCCLKPMVSTNSWGGFPQGGFETKIWWKIHPN